MTLSEWEHASAIFLRYKVSLQFIIFGLYSNGAYSKHSLVHKIGNPTQTLRKLQNKLSVPPEKQVNFPQMEIMIQFKYFKNIGF